MSEKTPPSKTTSGTKKKPWWRTALEFSAIIAIFFGVMLWQERHLLGGILSEDKKPVAPEQQLVALDGKTYQLPISQQQQLIYFFAPWCNVCEFSIDNIEVQKSSLAKKGYQVRYVALDWQTRDEVSKFAEKNQLSSPVLLGTQETMQRYQVKGFPTYYLIDQQGQVIAGSQGYSTALGVWLRSL